jgi:acetyl coenzyme A synthetase (ADP forming)-like protein
LKLDAFFKPRSIAVVGASRDPEKVGHRIFRNITDSGFEGNLYPINPNTADLMGYKCFKSVIEAPDEVDLAVIAVPAKIVPGIAEECGRKGVKGIVVISAGFGETGRDGTQRERELLSICGKYNMRMQGPNCLGIVNTQHHMNASFAAANPLSGNIAFVSQSGALGSSILNWTVQNFLGFTSFVSLGNEADLDAADFVEALADDENTRVIGLYIEGVKDGKRFMNVAKEATRKKPIIALKAGTTDVGMRAVSSHTGSLAGSDTAFSAAFKKTGILRARTLGELFDLVQAFEAQPVPKGKNVLVITNGGGPGILAADACENLGLELPSLELDVLRKLRNSLPPHASLGNPVDVLGDADEHRYATVLDVGLENDKVDAIMIILTPQAMTPAYEVAAAIAQARERYAEKPMTTVFMGFDEDSPTIRKLRKSKIPNYSFPESASYALKAMYDYSLILRMPSEKPPEPLRVDDTLVKEIITKARQERRRGLTIEEASVIAGTYGIPMPRAFIARSRKEAGEIADAIGYPVAMKIVSPEIMHKTDIGGVVLNLGTRQQVERNFSRLRRRTRLSMPQARISGVLVQQMVRLGKEVIVGAVRDPQFGPLMMFGLGGIYVNFLRDVSYRLCPLSRSEAREMIEETKAYVLLRGVRGEPASDIASIIDTVTRISQIMIRHEEIVEMEINPLCVYEGRKGCLALDIRITISP